ncbi:MAG: hypothetical protein QNJ45_29640, partial [Ardenticatenaceae bacterium]|nr:hypothetical protein [Ardenticatenaceae bacterium]
LRLLGPATASPLVMGLRPSVLIAAKQGPGAAGAGGSGRSSHHPRYPTSGGSVSRDRGAAVASPSSPGSSTTTTR